MSNDKKEIKFKYVFPDNYNPTYCNGAYGGVSTTGEIIANFYLERMPIPKYVTNLVNPDGTLGGVAEISPENYEQTVIRYISTGVVLNEESAKSFYEWLGLQIKELENRRLIGDSIPREE